MKANRIETRGPDGRSGRSEQVRRSILILDAASDSVDLLQSILEQAGYSVSGALTPDRALEIADRSRPDLMLLGLSGSEYIGNELRRRGDSLERVPVIVLVHGNDPMVRRTDLKLEPVDYIKKPFCAEDVVARVRAQLQFGDLNRNEDTEELSNVYSTEAAQSSCDEAINSRNLFGLVGRSFALSRVVADVRRLQKFDRTSVLILGESGTGKELVARALHDGSKRKGAFVPVNCAAIPAELLESSFFGHLRGAFTGALADRKGFFELAEEGTLFLDEVGEMHLSLQSKLLRALEDRLIMPLGGREEKKINVRILAATNVDLATRIKEGKFREDLFYRLSTFSVTLPPLRQRLEDITLLASHLLAQFAREMDIPTPAIHPGALTRLKDYSFPGNVRELKNILERALIEADAGFIRAEHLRLPGAAPVRKGAELVEELWTKVLEGEANFWTAVGAPYLDRELDRTSVRNLIDCGLSQTRGSYKELLRLFRLPFEEYTKFMDFLRFHRLKPERRSSESF